MVNAHGPAAEPGTAPDDRERGLARFTERAEALGVAVGRAADAAAGARWLAEVAAGWGATRGIAAAEVAASAPALLRELAALGIAADAAGSPETTRDAPLGISLARAAVAETGSVLLAEPTLEDRAIGMLAAGQAIICPTEGLVPSLDEAMAALVGIAAGPRASYATLVTGPSRTADIERVLTVGVQGPARVAVLFLDRLA